MWKGAEGPDGYEDEVGYFNTDTKAFVVVKIVNIAVMTSPGMTAITGQYWFCCLPVSCGSSWKRGVSMGATISPYYRSRLCPCVGSPDTNWPTRTQPSCHRARARCLLVRHDDTYGPNIDELDHYGFLCHVYQY